MSKVLKVIVVGISVLMVTLPAYALEAGSGLGTAAVPKAQGTPAVSKEQAGQAVSQAGQAVTKEQVKPEVAREKAGQAASRQEAGPKTPGDRSRLDAAKEQIKGLDEQVQEIKTDVLGIATELNRLEEKLLYPSDTQIAVFVSLAPGAEKFRLDAVDIELDGKQVAHHLYTFKELEALQKGGVQRIHVGNVRTGEHPVRVTVLGKTEGGSDFQREENFKVTKAIGPKLVGVVLAGSKTITMKDW